MGRLARQGSGRGRRVLIVDDEAPILFAMREYFGSQGCTVDTATEMEEAEALLGHRPYDLVIADLRLTSFPGSEGLEIVAFVKERCPHTRVILFTGHGSPEVADEAHRLRVDAFLIKPRPLAEVAEVAFGLMEASPAGEVVQ